MPANPASRPRKTALSFRHQSGGDTDAFDTTGRVTVQVTVFNGNSECKFQLHAAADGRQLDFGSVRQGGGSLSLDPGGQSSVYIRNLHCGARMSADDPIIEPHG